MSKVLKDGLIRWVSITSIVFVIYGALFPNKLKQAMEYILGIITNNFGWMYLVVVLGFVAFCLSVAVSKYGKVKLGKPEDVPEYSTFSWFAMLFSAGMGIGLVFWGVAEPLSHYNNPPVGTPRSAEAMLVAMRYTFFHWGVHAWASYCLVGLTLAYFSFNKGAPMLISTTVQPLLGDKIFSWQGKVLDGLAVFATVFGVATSLGMGTLQINSGLNYLFGIPQTPAVSIAIVAVITCLFTLSAFSGIGRGIKLLSNFNMVLAVLILLLMLGGGPAKFIIDLLVKSVGLYLNNFFSMSFGSESIRQPGWVNSWTVFYWAWWIAWAPFTGMFIARISKGRTIREFILGVLVVPTICCFVWMGTFGGAALHLELAGLSVVDAVLQNIAAGLFIVFHSYPLSALISGLTLILIVTFFITSADSATFVVSMLISGGSLEPTAKTKVFWGVVQGTIAIILMLTGGLAGLQTASIIVAFPFMFVMLMMAYAIYCELGKSGKFPQRIILRRCKKPND